MLQVLIKRTNTIITATTTVFDRRTGELLLTATYIIDTSVWAGRGQAAV
jgi:hypothetical protein